MNNNINNFERVIGYEDVKAELLEICDMVKNKEVYTKLGAKMPKGVLLYGVPGIGKSLLSECFIAECGLPYFTIRKGKGSGQLMEDIAKAFEKAKKSSPAIVYLDDMDKFANEDNKGPNGEEYVAVQSGIDSVKGCDVLVVATVNDMDCLPDSLIRPGRFDRMIEMNVPDGEDAMNIIKHYLSEKEVADDVNLTDIAKMISYSSCAELETILNEAAIRAGRERRENIGMDNIVSAVLKMQYRSPDNLTEVDPIELEKTALHEAGHLVVSEILTPGSVGLASVKCSTRNPLGGFIHICKDIKRRPYNTITALAGKAAVELYYSDTVASGCSADLMKAVGSLKGGIEHNAALGLSAINKGGFKGSSDIYDYTLENVVGAELERYMQITRDILLKNRTFLEKAKDELVKKRVLLASDIERIKSECEIINVAV